MLFSKLHDHTERRQDVLLGFASDFQLADESLDVEARDVRDRRVSKGWQNVFVHDLPVIGKRCVFNARLNDSGPPLSHLSEKHAF